MQWAWLPRLIFPLEERGGAGIIMSSSVAVRDHNYLTDDLQMPGSLLRGSFRKINGGGGGRSGMLLTLGGGM